MYYIFVASWKTLPPRQKRERRRKRSMAIYVFAALLWISSGLTMLFGFDFAASAEAPEAPIVERLPEITENAQVEPAAEELTVAEVASATEARPAESVSFIGETPRIEIEPTFSKDSAEQSLELAELSLDLNTQEAHFQFGEATGVAPEAQAVVAPDVALDITGQLIIPDINMVETITDVPFENNQWDIDELDDQVGLLEGTGRFPGDHYSMVFTGHVTTQWPTHGPFFHIDHLFPGDEIIYRVGNDDYVYTITRMLYVEPDEVDRLIDPNGDQILLVTCGQLNFLTGEYTKRLVIKAELTRIDSLEFQ